MKLLAITILKLFIHIYLYLRNLYISFCSFMSFDLKYSKEKGLYIYTFYDINNKYKTLYFLNHKDFRDYLNKHTDANLQIIHAALITDTDYLVDLTDHVKSFAYYFKDPSKLPWKKVIDTVNYQTPHEKNLKMYIQSTNTTGNSIQHSEKTFDAPMDLVS